MGSKEMNRERFRSYPPNGWKCLNTHRPKLKNGIEIDMNTGTGWPFGGPDITLNHAATRAIFEQYSVTGGKEIVQNISINNPKEKNNAKLPP